MVRETNTRVVQCQRTQISGENLNCGAEVRLQCPVSRRAIPENNVEVKLEGSCRRDTSHTAGFSYALLFSG
jgi:hypothetical protein